MALRGGVVSGTIIAAYSGFIYTTVLNLTGTKGMLNSVVLSAETVSPSYYNTSGIRITIDGSVSEHRIFTSLAPLDEAICNFWAKINLPFITSLKVEIKLPDHEQLRNIDYFIKYIKEI